MDQYGLIVYDPASYEPALAPHVRAELDREAAGGALERVRNIVRRLAPDADAVDSRILQYGVVGFYHADDDVRAPAGDL